MKACRLGVFATFGLVLVNIISGQEATPDYRSLFTRHSDKRLSSIHAGFATNSTLNLCSLSCVTETVFTCKSFNYDNVRRSCFLYSVNLNDRDVHLIDFQGRDHYEASYLKRFNRLPNHVVQVAASQRIPAVSAEECSRRCVLETRFKCRGFNYRMDLSKTSHCLLVESTPGTGSAPAVFSEGYDFYQLETESSLSSFINYGMGLLRPFSSTSTDIYQRSVRGIGLEDCARRCLDERTFTCLSIDYVYENKELENVCHLSQYLAANVQGLVVDSSNPRHNHFERIERYLNHFYATPHSYIQGNNLKTFVKVTPNRCARLCLEEDAFVCRSFDYKVLPEATCLLSSKTARDVGGLDSASSLEASINHFEMKPLLDCGGNLTEPEDGIASPNWPRKYAHHEDCEWNIEVSKHKVIQLRFTHFELGLQSADSCSDGDDRLMVAEPGVKLYCVMPNTKQITTKTNRVALRFVSNAEVDAQGFRAFYSAEWTCKVNLKEAPGEFASPKWPGNYPSGSRCSWRITAPEGQRVRLTFTSFALEQHTLGHCNDKFDHVRILDGGTVGSSLIGLYCGLHNPFAILSSGRDILVQFSSDNDPHNTRPGFHANFVFEMVNGSSLEPRFIDLGVKTSDEERWKGTEEEDTHILGAQVGSENSSQDRTDNSISDGYRSTMWAIITCLLLIVVALTLALFLVIRHYRQKLRGGQQEKVIENGDRSHAAETVPLQSFQPSFQRKQQFNNLVDLSGDGAGASSASATRDEDSTPSRKLCGSSESEESKNVLPSSSSLQMPRPPPRTHRPHSSYGKYHEDNIKNINVEDKTQV